MEEIEDRLVKKGYLKRVYNSIIGKYNTIITQEGWDKIKKIFKDKRYKRLFLKMILEHTKNLDEVEKKIFFEVLKRDLIGHNILK